MAKTKISEWSSTPANNTDIDSINIAEGCAPSGINDAIRELMSQVKDLYSGTTGDAIGVAGGGTGQTSYTNGQLLIGNTTGNTLTKATLTAGSNVTITNGTGSITIAASGASSATPTTEGIVYGKMTSGGGTPFLTALGYNAAPAMTTGTRTVAVGREALLLNTSGDRNHAFGMGALGSNLTGSYNTAVGYTALNASTADNNTAVGYQALPSTTSSSGTAVGYQAGYSNTIGSQLTAIGFQAAYVNTTGNRNTAVGHSSSAFNLTGSLNTSVGYSALTYATGSYNTAIGDTSGYGSTGASTGSQNTFLGRASGFSFTTGSSNTFTGDGAGYYVTTGSKNSILGSYNGNQNGLDIRTASNKVVASDGDGNIVFHNDSSQWTSTAFCNVDITQGTAGTSTVNTIAITSGTATTIFGTNTNSFSGVFIINDMNSTGACALVITSANTLTIISQSAGSVFVTSSTPTSAQVGLYTVGSSVTVKPGLTGTTNFRIMAFRTRGSQ